MKLASRSALAIGVAAFVGLALAANTRQASENPEQVVKKLYAAFEHGDMDALEELIAPEATWTYYGPPSELPFGGVRRGPEGVADFFAKVGETLENPVASQREFLVDGDTVIVPGIEESTVKSTGIRYRADNVHIFKIRDGKIIRFEEFIDSGKVLLAFQGDKAAAVATGLAVNAPKPTKGAVDTSVGKAVFTTCVGCHGNAGEGRAMMFAPNLTGLSSEYIASQLRNFRQGRRGKVEDGHGFPMVGRATAIGDQSKVDAVVRYIATLPDVPAAPVASRTIPAGLSTQIATCASCHGDVGQGNAEMGGPSINTLDSKYIAEQLHKFRNDIRGYAKDDPQGQLMASAAKAVPAEADYKRIAEYFGR